MARTNKISSSLSCRMYCDWPGGRAHFCSIVFAQENRGGRAWKRPGGPEKDKSHGWGRSRVLLRADDRRDNPCCRSMGITAAMSLDQSKATLSSIPSCTNAARGRRYTPSRRRTPLHQSRCCPAITACGTTGGPEKDKSHGWSRSRVLLCDGGQRGHRCCRSMGIIGLALSLDRSTTTPSSIRYRQPAARADGSL